MKTTARRVGRDAGRAIARRRRTRLAAVLTALAAAALVILGAPAVAPPNANHASVDAQIGHMPVSLPRLS